MADARPPHDDRLTEAAPRCPAAAVAAGAQGTSPRGTTATVGGGCTATRIAAEV